MTFSDAQMVEQGEVVGSVGVPAIGSAARSARLTRIALVHRDHAEIGGEFLGRVKPAFVPELDTRPHSTGREKQQRVTRTEFFIVERNASALEFWHDNYLHIRDGAGLTSPAPRTLPSELAIKARARKSRTQSRLIYVIASANLMALRCRNCAANLAAFCVLPGVD